MTWNTLFAATINGEWRPGIGDPTVMGWITVAAYLLAALACGRVAFMHGRAAFPSARGGVAFWGALAVLLLLLGINKQLDLQSWITVIGKKAARVGGWYQERRKYQSLFVGLVGAGGMLGLAVLGWLARKASWPRWLALLGVVYLVCFIVIRAASFHRVDQFLKVSLAGTRTNVLLELGGIACVGIAAVYEARRVMGRPRGPVGFERWFAAARRPGSR